MRRRYLASSLAAMTLMAALIAPPSDAAIRSPVALANRCLSIESARDGAVVTVAGPKGYRALARAGANAGAFYLKPTAPGAYMLYDAGGRLMGVEREAVVRAGGAEAAGRTTEWSVARVAPQEFTVRSTAKGRFLSVAARGGGLALGPRDRAGPRSRFAFVPTRGCLSYPEAEVGASGRSFAGANRDGTVPGFADTHLHITADMRAGGRVVHGEPFDRFGITRALGGDARDHGGDGSLDVTGNLLRAGIPFGTHSTQGWPTFVGWPVYDTSTHQQTYYVWLQRAWRAGLRLVVAQTVEDDELCRIEPRRAHSCSEPKTIALEVRRLRALQDYVDAQNGGAGRGWFRLVYDPRTARRVIERGKLAVVIGVESSNPFGCSLRGGRSRCTRADVDRGIAAYHRLGVRSLFVAHWFDNAFTGAAFEGGTKGKFINAMNRLETGHYFAAGRCPARGQGEEATAPSEGELKVVAPFFPAVRRLMGVRAPAYPARRRCNTRGLTALGRYLIRRLMTRHMLIEADHMSEKARERVLGMAKVHDYPLISSHNGTGGTWTPSELRRLYALGGLASATPGTAPELAERILRQGRFRSRRRYFGVGLGTDTGGFAALPAPAEDARLNPLRYPFKAHAGRVTFRRQRTGTRVFDLNADGVAHYGLLADLIADMDRRRRGRDALALLFRSAESYLQMWQRAQAGR